MQPCPDDPQGEGWWIRKNGSWQAGEWSSVGTEQENTVVVSVSVSICHFVLHCYFLVRPQGHAYKRMKMKAL